MYRLHPSIFAAEKEKTFVMEEVGCSVERMLFHCTLDESRVKRRFNDDLELQQFSI
jgi:hypothetical protein